MKKIKFLFLLIIPVYFLFPKNVFAQSITPNNTQIYWQAYPVNDSSDVQSSAFDVLQNQFYLWGSSFADFKLIRNGLLVDYTSLGASTYQYKVRFYIATNTNYIGMNNVSCSLWATDIYNQSCSVDGFGITTDISGGGGFTTHYVDISYNFSTYGSGYVEFWINYNNMILTPKLAKFAYKQLSFEGQINPTSIIVDQNTTIINQNNETNNKIDKTNDILEDDDVSGANSDASSFFNDFTTTDYGGISSVVKAPLVAFNSMLSNQCTPLTTTWKGQQISLPCGTDFWSQLGELKTFINLTYGGILCYMIAVKLFKLINRLKNPDDDKVEVMDL